MAAEMSPVETFARRIYVHWDAWEAEAGDRGQQSQDPDEAHEFMVECIAAELTALVEQAAMVCEGRANHLKTQIPVYNEAMKCADQIRHNLTQEAAHA